MLWTLFSILDTFDSEVIPASSHGGSLRLRETMHISLTHDYFLRVMIYISGSQLEPCLPLRSLYQK